MEKGRGSIVLPCSDSNRDPATQGPYSKRNSKSSARGVMGYTHKHTHVNHPAPHHDCGAWLG